MRLVGKMSVFGAPSAVRACLNARKSRPLLETLTQRACFSSAGYIQPAHSASISGSKLARFGHIRYQPALNGTFTGCAAVLLCTGGRSYSTVAVTQEKDSGLLMTRYVQEGEYHKMVSELRALKARGQVPDAQAFHAILEACVQYGDTVLLQSTLEAMSGVVTMDEEMVLQVLKTYRRAGQPHTADKFLQYARQTLQIRPSIRLLNEVLYTCLEAGHWPRALAVAAQINKYGLPPNDRTWAGLLKAWGHTKGPHALDNFEDIWISYISTHQNHGRVVLAEYVRGLVHRKQAAKAAEVLLQDFAAITVRHSATEPLHDNQLPPADAVGDVLVGLASALDATTLSLAHNLALQSSRYSKKGPRLAQAIILLGTRLADPSSAQLRRANPKATQYFADAEVWPAMCGDITSNAAIQALLSRYVHNPASVTLSRLQDIEQHMLGCGLTSLDSAWLPLVTCTAYVAHSNAGYDQGVSAAMETVKRLMANGVCPVSAFTSLYGVVGSLVSETEQWSSVRTWLLQAEALMVGHFDGSQSAANAKFMSTAREALLWALLKGGHHVLVANAYFMFKKDLNLPFTVSMYEITLQALANIDRPFYAKRSLGVWSKMEHEHNIAPNTPALTTTAAIALMRCAKTLRSPVRAMRVFENLPFSHRYKNPTVLAALLEACRGGNVLRSRRMFERALQIEMPKYKIQPTSPILLSAIRHYASWKQPVRALGYLEEMLDLPDKDPYDLEQGYSACIESLGRNGRADAGFELLKRCREEGIKPTEKSFYWLAKFCLDTEQKVVTDDSYPEYVPPPQKGLVMATAVVNMMLADHPNTTRPAPLIKRLAAAGVDLAPNAQ